MSYRFSLIIQINFRLSQCVKGMLAFSIYITHSLQCYVAIDIMWNDYIRKRLSEKRNKLFWEYVLRTGCVTVTC